MGGGEGEGACPDRERDRRCRIEEVDLELLQVLDGGRARTNERLSAAQSSSSFSVTSSSSSPLLFFVTDRSKCGLSGSGSSGGTSRKAFCSQDFGRSNEEKVNIPKLFTPYGFK